MAYESDETHRRQGIEQDNRIIDAFASGEVQPDRVDQCESCGRMCEGQYCCEPCQHHGTLKWLCGEMLKTIQHERNASLIPDELRKVSHAWASTFESAGGNLTSEET